MAEQANSPVNQLGQIRSIHRARSKAFKPGTNRELGRRAGVSQPQLSRFVSGERTLTLPAAAKVCETLGLRLIYPPYKLTFPGRTFPFVGFGQPKHSGSARVPLKRAPGYTRRQGFPWQLVPPKIQKAQEIRGLYVFLLYESGALPLR